MPVAPAGGGGPASVPRSAQPEPQKIGSGVQLGDQALEDNAAWAGDRHEIAGWPGLAGGADELAVSLVVLDEGGEVGEHGRGRSITPGLRRDRAYANG